MIYCRWFFSDEAEQENGPFPTKEIAEQAQYLYAQTLSRELTEEEGKELKEYFDILRNGEL